MLGRKLRIESNVYAKFQIHTTCRQKVNLFWGGEGGGEREERVISPPSWNQRTWKSSWGIGLYKCKFQFIEPCMIVTVREVFKQKLCNELRELRHCFFAKHFLLFRNIAYNPWIFYCKKESLNSASSYQEDAKILIRVAAIITQEKNERFVCLLEKYLRLYMIKWLY